MRVCLNATVMPGSNGVGWSGVAGAAAIVVVIVIAAAAEHIHVDVRKYVRNAASRGVVHPPPPAPYLGPLPPMIPVPCVPCCVRPVHTLRTANERTVSEDRERGRGGTGKKCERRPILRRRRRRRPVLRTKSGITLYDCTCVLCTG